MQSWQVTHAFNALGAKNCQKIHWDGADRGPELVSAIQRAPRVDRPVDAQLRNLQALQRTSIYFKNSFFTNGLRATDAVQDRLPRR